MRWISAFTLAWAACQVAAPAQDLEPRRWTHLPVGMNVGGLTYVYTDGDPSTAWAERPLILAVLQRAGLRSPYVEVQVDGARRALDDVRDLVVAADAVLVPG